MLALGLTQTIAWASSTYLPAILAQPIASDLGVSRATVFGAFSVSLVVMAFAGPPVGRAIDRDHGREVLALSNLVIASGLVFLGYASDTLTLFGAWCVLGVGMAMGLYDAAFATLVRLYAGAARRPITGITLVAGFASTVGWPLTAYLADQFGWRASCFAWALIHVCLALPVNLYWLPSIVRARSSGVIPAAPAQGGIRDSAQGTKAGPKNERQAFVLLVLFAATTAFVTSAMAAHLPGLLLAMGTSPLAALTAATLLGPAQVAARVFEFAAAHRFRVHPVVTARIATALHPIGGLVLLIFGGPPLAAAGFSVLHGAGNGMITIAKGTLPLAVFGPEGYGLRQGLLNMLARFMQAIAPFTFGLVVETYDARAAIALSGGLSLVALAALLALRVSPR